MFNFLQKKKLNNDSYQSLSPVLNVTRHGGSVLRDTVRSLKTFLYPSQNIMLSRQAKIQEDTYFRIMHLLQETPDLTQRELADKLGVSVGGINYCLKALIEKGWIKMRNFSDSKNKFGYAYVLTPKGLKKKAILATHFLKRKLEEYELLKAEIETLSAEADQSKISQYTAI